ncbi:PmoA family protein [Rhodopirellula sp. SWK7]|uniref:DUF6807 domain-containing protein n=1 Tax=Rhodopirellula sp. SWK7 TaxID=595460 RepID=UPI0002BFF3EF|nr:PmoA family protein [Rhodopirellula sp. SWK7]EMI43585.1 hypothetical protein RRSWK_03922 [Rhodopirellula sp. SWK7]
MRSSDNTAPHNQTIHDRTVLFKFLTLFLSLAATADTVCAQSQTSAVGFPHETSDSNTSTATAVANAFATTGVSSHLGYRTEMPSSDLKSPVWQIYRGDQAITTYHANLKGTPGFYPLLSPRGLPLTRNFPMQASDTNNDNAQAARRFERSDHDHHRSVWFTHGIVNEYDFWLDDPRPEMGRVVHRSGDVRVRQTASVINGEETSSSSCTIVTTNDWLTPDEKRLLSDRRQFRFGEHLGDTVIDITVELTAADDDVMMGDTKEGTLGVRVAGTMKVDAKLGGEIHNAEGLRDAAAWGKPSHWVDYSGPIVPSDWTLDTDETNAENAASWPRAGITMMYHPGNELPTCNWHVRTYGLFAANPFGRRQFGDKTANAANYEGVKIKKGQTLTLNARMILHDGGFDATKSAAHFDAYSATKVK